MILSVRGSVSDIAQYSIVSINRGSRDGVEVGHVLATMRSGEYLSGTQSSRPPLIADLFPNLTGMKFEVTPNPPVPDTVVAGQDPQEAPAPTAGRFRSYKLPDERSGLLIIFRTFEKISYGMILKSVRPISVGDVVQTP
jgi:hypothetical protein